MANVFCQWLMISLFQLVHPFYVSVTELNYNKTDKTIEISCKLFTDDLERTLSQQYKQPVDLSHPKDKAQVDKLVAGYLQQHLHLKINGQPVVIQYMGYEKEGEAAWCYLVVNAVPEPKQLQINANMLYEVFDSQIHIIHATVNGKRQSTKIANPRSEALFDFGQPK